MKPETKGTLILGFSCFVTVVLLARSVYKLHLPWQQLPGWVLQNAVWLGFVGVILFLLSIYVPALDPTRIKRPFAEVPWEAPWWEFIVSGVFFGVFVPVYTLLLISVVVILPVVAPLRLLRSYILGPEATLSSAILSFPLLFLTASIAFMILYMLLISNQKGNLLRGNQSLNAGQGWSAWEVFYFSLSTMIKGTPQYEATGWCRWAALLEVLLARLLELLVVTIGFAIIIRRSYHP